MIGSYQEAVLYPLKLLTPILPFPKMEEHKIWSTNGQQIGGNSFVLPYVSLYVPKR